MQEIPTQVRQDILKSARQLFKTRGYDQTSLEDILRETAISRRTFSDIFLSKDDLLEVLWSE
jgi:AcrR family transcriptional regulator